MAIKLLHSNRPFFLSIIMVLLFHLFSPMAYALDEENTFYKNYPIRQVQYSNNGIHVSEPNTFDKTIFDAINLYQIRTLEAYAKWLDGYLTYQEDGIFDRWAKPEITLKKRRGDCEDYAILNMVVLRKLGFETRFVGLFRKGKAHAICVVKQNGYYVWLDNAKLNRTTARTLQELGRQITEEYAYYKLGEYDVKSDTWDMFYEKKVHKAKI